MNTNMKRHPLNEAKSTRDLARKLGFSVDLRQSKLETGGVRLSRFSSPDGRSVWVGVCRRRGYYLVESEEVDSGK
jgi:hypothetical protein